MSRPSGREIARRRRENEAGQAIRAYIDAKTDLVKAAEKLCISESTLRRRLKDYVSQGDYLNLVQAAYWLDR